MKRTIQYNEIRICRFEADVPDEITNARAMFEWAHANGVEVAAIEDEIHYDVNGVFVQVGDDEWEVDL